MVPSDCLRSKPKLLVVLGAGSSIPCGMPSVSQIDEHMKCWSWECALESSVDPKGNVFDILWKASKHYYKSNHYGICPNYERVLGEMTALASWLSPRPFGNPIIEVMKDGTLVNALEWLHDMPDEYAGRKLVLSQQTFLLEKLADHMRHLGKTFDSQSSEFSDYTEFFRRLRERFDFGIYNLNYDTVARTAWPGAYWAYCGFDLHGNFDPSGVSQRCDWDFVYHLHGSVHHCITADPHRIGWQEDLGGKFLNQVEIAPDMAQDFQSAPLTTYRGSSMARKRRRRIWEDDEKRRIVAQTRVPGVGFSLRADSSWISSSPIHIKHSIPPLLVAVLILHTQEADALLIAGYGFGDLHVNRALRNRFEGPDDKAPRVVVLEKSPHEKLQTASLQSRERRKPRRHSPRPMMPKRSGSQNAAHCRIICRAMRRFWKWAMPAPPAAASSNALAKM